VIHAVLLEAVQLHPAVVVTATVPFPPADAKNWLGGEMENVQEPDCVTVNVCPATVTVPVREPVPMFAATE
jgi:hypothetical protein